MMEFAETSSFRRKPYPHDRDLNTFKCGLRCDRFRVELEVSCDKFWLSCYIHICIEYFSCWERSSLNDSVLTVLLVGIAKRRTYSFWVKFG